jgi:vacuolar-type H+-ATPase subunit H
MPETGFSAQNNGEEHTLINEVVVSIRESEQEAARLVDEGRKNARNITGEARQRSEKEAAAIVEEARERVAAGMAQAEGFANNKAAKVLEDGGNNINAQKGAARARLGVAVDLILERLN